MSKPRSPLRSPTLKEIIAGAERAAKRMESWPKWKRDLSRNPSQRQPSSSPEPKPKETHHMETIRITIDVTYSGDSPDPSTLLDSVQDNCAGLLDPHDETPVDDFNVSVEEK